MKKIFLIVSLGVLLFVGYRTHAATTLVPGDISIVSVNSDSTYPGGANSNGFNFVSRVDLQAGTQIYFADKGWDGSLGTPFWRNTTGEGLVRYTVPAGGITRGTIVHYDDTMVPVLPSSGTGTWDMYSINSTTGALTLTTAIASGFEPASAGDNILVFQDSTGTNTAASPTFIHGIGWSAGTTWISSGTPTTNNSWIPTGISSASGTVITLGSPDNYQYSCTVTGLFNPAFTTTLQTVGNWTSSDTVPYATSTCSFDATQPVPTITQTAGQNDPTNNSVITFRVTFDTGIDPLSFTTADITLSGTATASITSLTQINATVWDIVITATAPGTVQVNIPAGSTIESGSGNISGTTIITDGSVLYDNTAPVLTQVTPVASPTGDTTPDYVLSTTEAGIITYGGSCASTTTTATIGNNTISFSTLPNGTYTNCTITVTDAAGNTSNILMVPAFTIDTTLPTLLISVPTQSTSAFTATITPSEPITGFTLSDIVVTNGVVTNLLGPDGTGNYTVTITPILPGNITVQVAATSVIDMSGNTNTASNITTTAYTTPPVSSSGGGVVYCTDTITTFCKPYYVTPISIPVSNTETLGKPGQCSADLLITQDMRAGARNGRINNYSQSTIVKKEIVREVKILQQHMNRLGFNSGQIDGILGPVTDGAIKRMQKFLGTYQDGRVGPITRSLINNSCGT